MCGIGTVCCAWTTNGHATAVPPASVTNSRRLMHQFPRLKGTQVSRSDNLAKGLMSVQVKLRRTQSEHMFSALPSNSDIAQCGRHFAFCQDQKSSTAWIMFR